MSTDILTELGRKLDETAPALSRLDTYWTGSQPAAFLSPVAVEALGNRAAHPDRQLSSARGDEPR